MYTHTTKPVGHILRNATYQAYSRATVTLDQKRKHIELRYAKA